ncbi:MAG: hypothetical protein Q8R06_02045 [Polaromonas sp.]|uniref:hypothetical protein n=1 Tax=Polaromonas sp. TaxID=1869339 RepID=UPI0027377846|nr:hypothetical protein [Polaromonas sp.]MDP3795918.1 hypothetical protein [Polaromonas sp.]
MDDQQLKGHLQKQECHPGVGKRFLELLLNRYFPGLCSASFDSVPSLLACLCERRVRKTEIYPVFTSRLQWYRNALLAIKETKKRRGTRLQER